MCTTIKISIKKSIDGLKNLKITYTDDSEIVARLIILINRLEKTLTSLEDFNDNININFSSNFNLDIDNELPTYNTIDNTTDNIIDKNTDKIKKLVGESSSSKTHNIIDNKEIDRDPNSDNKQLDNQDNLNQDKEKSTLSNVVNNSKKQSTKNIDRQTSTLMDTNLKNFTLNNGKK